MTQNSKKSKQQTPAVKEGQADEKPNPYGRWLRFLFELTYILTVLVFGTFVGTFLALLLPLGFPLLILYKRYIKRLDGTEEEDA